MYKIIDYYKNLPKNEWRVFRKSVTWAEYILWWVIRILMIYALVQVCKWYKAGEKDLVMLLQVSATTLATFLVTILRIVFPKQIFLGRIPYTTQKYASVCVFFCSFIGHYLDYCTKPGFDSLLHILTGFLLVFVCYEIVMSMQITPKPVSGFMASVIGFGMNCFVIIFWEIFEFTTDYLFGGNLQAYIPAFSDGDRMLFDLFGNPAAQEQLPVFDTMIDMISALLSAVPAAILLWVKVSHQNKKSGALQNSEPASAQVQTEETATAVCT